VSAATAAPAPAVVDEDERYARLLLASEGRPIEAAAIERIAELAATGGAVHVLSIARVHGTSLGMPNPGLLPTRAEWAEQRGIVAAAVAELRRLGLTVASGHVLGTRKATKAICDQAKNLGCGAIVMSADADRSRVVADLMWSQEPQRVRRRSGVPVFLVAT
jgi:nucleotide-binding universal stress UspA family protein